MEPILVKRMPGDIVKEWCPWSPARHGRTYTLGKNDVDPEGGGVPMDFVSPQLWELLDKGICKFY